MSVNKVALRETMDAVLAAASEDGWEQTRWIGEDQCGTYGCFAGWRVILDGGVMHKPDTDVYPATYGAYARMPDGRVVQVREYAVKQLGLSQEQAEEMFHANNTLEDLKHLVDPICDEDDRG